MIRAHRIRLLPVAVQERAFYDFAKVVRWTWNTVLRTHNAQVAEWISAGRVGDAPTIVSLKPVFNVGRPIFAAWTTEKGHRDCWSQPFTDLRKAFAAKRAGTAAHPRYKRFDDVPSFYVANDKFEFGVKGVRLPKVGWVRTTESLRLPGKILGARVTRDSAGCWFVSVQVEVVRVADAVAGIRKTEVIGVDVGITNTITLSTGEVFHAPRTTEAERAKMRRLQRSKARKYEARKASRNVVRAAGGDVRDVRISKRERRARLAIGRLHTRIADRRNDWQHKTTTAIVRRSAAIGLEMLSINGMMRSKRRGQARALSDIGLGEIHRQIRYKSDGSETVVQNWPRSYPSSQLCSSGCGHRQKMPLGTRIYRCPCCECVKDRDVNAALNLVPSAWRVMRGPGPPDQNAGKQATMGLPVVRPVPVESVKPYGSTHVRT